MSRRQRLLLTLPALAAFGVLAASVLNPILGQWRTAAIVFLSSMLIFMYVQHRWPLGKERQP